MIELSQSGDLYCIYYGENREQVMEHTVRRLVNPVGLHRNVVYLMTQFTDNLPLIGKQASSTIFPSSDRQRCVECKKNGKSVSRSNRAKGVCAKCYDPVSGKHSVSSLVCDSCNHWPSHMSCCQFNALLTHWIKFCDLKKLSHESDQFDHPLGLDVIIGPWGSEG